MGLSLQGSPIQARTSASLQTKEEKSSRFIWVEGYRVSGLRGRGGVNLGTMIRVCTGSSTQTL